MREEDGIVGKPGISRQVRDGSRRCGEAPVVVGEGAARHGGRMCSNILMASAPVFLSHTLPQPLATPECFLKSPTLVN